MERKAISATIGHVPNSAVLDRYIRRVDQWNGDDNALIGIGPYTVFWSRLAFGGFWPFTVDCRHGWVRWGA